MDTGEFLTINGAVERVGQWAERTFPNQTPGSIVSHLSAEVDELAGALARWEMPESDADETDHSVADELADCAILLFAAAAYCNVDLTSAITRAHNRNVGSRFGFDEATGFHKRIKV